MAESELEQAGIARPYVDAPLAIEEEEDSIDLIALFQILRRGKRIILLSSLVVFALATIYAFLLPFRYTSTVICAPVQN